jgi:hypothetical protein
MRRRDISELPYAFGRSDPEIERLRGARVFVCICRQCVDDEQIHGAIAAEAFGVEDRAKRALRGAKADNGGPFHIGVGVAAQGCSHTLLQRGRRLWRA